MTGVPAPSGLRRALAGLALAALPCAALYASLPTAKADVLDATQLVTVVVGMPRGHAVGERGDPYRSGRAKDPLPTSAGEIWRKQLGTSIDGAALVDDAGNVLVASQFDLVKISASGRELWRARVGTSTVVSSPALLADGSVVVLTQSGRLVSVASDGSLRFTSDLSIRGRDVEVAPLPTASGTVVVGAGRSLLEVSGDGGIKARAELPETAVGALVLGPNGVLATGESGAVYEWKTPQQPRKIGSFGGSVKRPNGSVASAGGAVLSGTKLFAVVDNKRVVAVDVRTGAASVRSSASPLGLGFEGPPAVGKTGTLYVGTAAGFVVGLDGAGDEVFSAAAERNVVAADAGAPVAALLPPHYGGGYGYGGYGYQPVPQITNGPGPIVDGDGRVAFARYGGRVGVADAAGAVSIGAERLCGTPVGLQPGGRDRFVVTCRDGSVVMLGRR